MDLNLENTMPFGKHKGQQISQIIKQNPGYLVWLREERKKDSGDIKFFSHALNALLDAEIFNSKSLKRDYAAWNLPPETATAPAKPAPRNREAMMAYEGWGEF